MSEIENALKGFRGEFLNAVNSVEEEEKRMSALSHGNMQYLQTYVEPKLKEVVRVFSIIPLVRSINYLNEHINSTFPNVKPKGYQVITWCHAVVGYDSMMRIGIGYHMGKKWYYKIWWDSWDWTNTLFFQTFEESWKGLLDEILKSPHIKLEAKEKLFTKDIDAELKAMADRKQLKEQQFEIQRQLRIETENNQKRKAEADKAHDILTSNAANGAGIGGLGIAFGWIYALIQWDSSEWV